MRHNGLLKFQISVFAVFISQLLNQTVIDGIMSLSCSCGESLNRATTAKVRSLISDFMRCFSVYLVLSASANFS